MSRIVPVAGYKSLHSRRPNNVACPQMAPFTGSASGGVRAIKGPAWSRARGFTAIASPFREERGE
jgi:hypothetical protein